MCISEGYGGERAWHRAWHIVPLMVITKKEWAGCSSRKFLAGSRFLRRALKPWAVGWRKGGEVSWSPGLALEHSFWGEGQFQGCPSLESDSLGSINSSRFLLRAHPPPLDMIFKYANAIRSQKSTLVLLALSL